MASDGAALQPPAKAARMPVSGLEVGLLDVGRVVALNGYAPACRRLAFVSRDFYSEDDLLVACKLVRYGVKQRTRLMSLARKGDLRRVSLLLDVGADVNAASITGHLDDIVRLLFDGSADEMAKDTDGCTALHHASIAGHVDVVRLLLDVNAEDNKGWTALLHAERHGHHAVTALLVGKGASLDCTDENVETVLGWAIARGDMKSVRRLVALGAGVSGEDIYYLIDACAAGNVELVRLLLEREADGKKRDLNHKDEDGRTALLLAERNGHHAIVEMLVRAGASPDSLDDNRSTVLGWAIDRRDEASIRRLVALGAAVSGEYITYLHKASAAGNVAMVRLLIELGADVNAYDTNWWTPLLYAEHNGHHAVTALLVGARASLDWRDESDERSVLDWAIERNDLASIHRLYDLGAKIQKGNWGPAPLHVASRAGRVEAVRALLELGADVDAREGDGDSGPTALHIACEMGFAETARALVEGGADAAARDKGGNTPLELAVLHGNAETAAVVEEAVAAAAALAAAEDEGEEAVMAQGEGEGMDGGAL
jgi:ankyrin repeat protein